MRYRSNHPFSAITAVATLLIATQAAFGAVVTLCLVNPTGVLQLRARLRKEPGPRAGCGQSARPVRRAGAGNGVMVGIEAPAS